MLTTRPQTARTGPVLIGFFIVLILAVVFVVFRAAFPPMPQTSTAPADRPREPFRCPVEAASERIARADLIVTGSVFAVIPGPTGADVLITPDRVYKGQAPKEGITITAKDAEAGVSLSEGELHFRSVDPTYLLFLRQRSDGRFLTSRCDGSRFLGNGLSAEEEPLLNKP